MQWQAHTAAEMETVAMEILQQLSKSKQATILALQGELGAGKTTFTQALAQQLGVADVVTSPTFVVMKSYPTTNAQYETLIHIDAYRLESAEEMKVLGWEDFTQNPGTLLCVEWPEKIADLLPPDTRLLTITTDAQDVRTLTLTTYG